MLSQRTELEGIYILTPEIFEDHRGYFLESFNQLNFQQAIGREVSFVQDNQSYSKRNVLRGLHYQKAPFQQGKLVRCVHGRIYDVVVDIRPTSSTFGRWIGTTLSGDNNKQIWIPEGFAHGFLACSDDATVEYKATTFYTPEAEASIIWNDEELGITWPIGEDPILSTKDQNAPTFNELQAL